MTLVGNFTHLISKTDALLTRRASRLENQQVWRLQPRTARHWQHVLRLKLAHDCMPHCPATDCNSMPPDQPCGVCPS